MYEKFNLLKVQRAINYVFKDPEIIKNAFVHPSVESSGESSCSLTFVGRALIGFAASDYVSSRLSNASERELAEKKERIIAALETSSLANDKTLTDMLMLSALAEPLRESKKTHADLFYAICASVYKDGGLTSFKAFLMPYLRACKEVDEVRRRPHEGKVTQMAEDTPEATDTHIRNERLRRPAKSGSIGMVKAETVNNTEAMPVPAETKKERKLREKTEKKTEKKSLKNAPVIPESTKEVIEEPAPARPEKRFIRDPFAPVRLSDELRALSGGKGRDKASSFARNEARNEPKAQTVEPVKLETDSDNYKSLLQEFVQKNVRTPNVPLKYATVQTGRNAFRCTVTLNGMELASATAETKKLAEKDAAKISYGEMKSKSGRAYTVLKELGGSDAVFAPPTADYVSKINQHFQKLTKNSNAPVTYEKRRSAKRGEFTVALVLDGEEKAVGVGSDLKEAKQAAAKAVCALLGIS